MLASVYIAICLRSLKTLSEFDHKIKTLHSTSNVKYSGTDGYDLFCCPFILERAVNRLKKKKGFCQVIKNEYVFVAWSIFRFVFYPVIGQVTLANKIFILDVFQPRLIKDSLSIS